MMTTLAPAECTEAHVFTHIQALDSHAYEEVVMDIIIGTLPAPFDMRKTEADLYDYQRDMKDEYLPVIERALGIRHFQARSDKPVDVALAEANSLQWYYIAIRPEATLFTIIKARSPRPCPYLLVQFSGLAQARLKHRYEGNFDAFVPCGLAGTAGHVDGYKIGEDSSVYEPQQSAAVAHRLWRLAIERGGSVVSISPKEGGRKEDLEGGSANEPWIRMPQAALDDLWSSEVRPAASKLAAEGAAVPSGTSSAAAAAGSKARSAGASNQGKRPRDEAGCGDK
jgi:hypothetical protein